MQIKNIALRFTEDNFKKLSRIKEKLSKQNQENYTWETFFLSLVYANETNN